MKRTFSLLSATCLLLLIAAGAAAQTPPPPPSILLMVREDIKPGEMPAHEQEAAAYAQLLSKVNERITNPDLRSGRIALTPIAGNENEVTYLWGYDSFDDMEKSNLEMDRLATDAKLLKADFDRLQDNKLHVTQRDIITVYRPELGYHVGKMDIAQARYMVMTTVRVKPGHEDEYWEMVKKHVFPARDKAGIKATYAVFQASGGVPGTTYYIFRPVRSLAELDERAPVVTRNAMSEDSKNEVDKVTDKSVVLQETTFFRINPRISHVSPDIVARDVAGSNFWNPKPSPAANATTASRGRANRKQ